MFFSLCKCVPSITALTPKGTEKYKSVKHIIMLVK